MSEHTPGPFCVDHVETAGQLAGWAWVSSREGVPIADCRMPMVARETCEANAAYIVRCVNSHDDLLEACKDLLAEFDRYDATMTLLGRGHEDYGGQRAAARAAIAKASP